MESLLQCRSGRSQRRCLSKEFPGDAGLVDLWATLEKWDVNAFVQCLELHSACWINVPVHGIIPKSLNGGRYNPRYKSIGLVHQSLPGIPTDFSHQHVFSKHEEIIILKLKR